MNYNPNKDTRYIPVVEKAIGWLDTVPEPCSLGQITECMRSLFGSSFDMSTVMELVPENSDERRIVSACILYALIRIFTGKHPFEIWGSDIYTAGTALDCQAKAASGCISAYSALGLSPEELSLLEENQETMRKIIKGKLVRKFFELSEFKSWGAAELLTEGALMRNSFSAKLRASAWKERLCHSYAALAGEVPTVCAGTGRLGSFECSYVTVKGEDHVKCDDRSGFYQIRSKAWLAYCADGVGSEAMSHEGAELAAACIKECISNNIRVLHNNDFRLVKYIRKHLAKDAATLWRKRLRARKGRDVDYKMYSTTFLFTLITKSYVICGKVGDGNFLVETKPLSAKENSGCTLVIEDGYTKNSRISGVVNFNHLEKDPQALRITVFNAEEVDSIIMTSDGAEGLTMTPVGDIRLAERTNEHNLRRVLDKARTMNRDERLKYLRCTAAACASSNLLHGGRNDDCSIVHIKKAR